MTAWALQPILKRLLNTGGRQKVVDMNGHQISFAKANGRYFGKIVSALPMYIGFLMAGFTEKHQALHDLLAGTLVVRQ